MKAKGLILPGYACTSQIWYPIRAELDYVYDITWIDWPREFINKFHTIEAFADWLCSANQFAYCDFLIGHSMGGLIALELAKRDKGLSRQIVLIETFMLSPAPFFQNIFLEATSTQTERETREMLKRESVYYSSKLREKLREVDMIQLVSNLDVNVQAIYGDRGCKDPNQVKRELAWPMELHHQIGISLVSEACHFPMIENPGMTIDLLRTALK